MDSALISTFSKNQQFLEKFDRRLADKLYLASQSLQWEPTEDGSDYDLLHDQTVVLQNVCRVSLQAVLEQLKNPSRVLMQRFIANQAPKEVPQLLTDLLDSEQLVTLPQLQALNSDSNTVINDRSKIAFHGSLIPPHLLLMGAFSLINWKLFQQDSNLRSLVLLESDPLQLSAALHFFDFEELVLSCRDQKVKFNLLFLDTLADSAAVRSRILKHYADNNPLAFHSIGLIRSPVLSPALTIANSWMNAPDGFLDLVRGYLGNDTDEFNQVIHALYLGLSCDKNRVRLLNRDLPERQDAAILVASGPSLDANISLIKREFARHNLFASGSSIGALLRSGIVPHGVVLLEMSSIVYQDLLDLVSEGFDLKSIVAFVSAVVDPRIVSLFDDVVIFQRPLSSSLCLFPSEQSACLPQAGPQAANAGLEVVLRLGYRNLLLVGCDFGVVQKSAPRASGAMGISPREFDLPVAGARGKTIFSNADLSVTRQLFENALSLYNASAFSLGEGSKMKGVEHWREPNPDLLDKLPESTDTLNSIINDFPFRNVDVKALKSIIADAREYNQKALTLFLELLPQTEGLIDAKLFNEWCEYLSWKDLDAPSGERLHRRLTRFLVFFLAQPCIFDQSGIEWNVKVANVKASFAQIQSLYDQFYDMLDDILNFKQVPVWDSAWLKRRILSRLSMLPKD